MAGLRTTALPLCDPSSPAARERQDRYERRRYTMSIMRGVAQSG